MISNFLDWCFSLLSKKCMEGTFFPFIVICGSNTATLQIWFSLRTSVGVLGKLLLKSYEEVCVQLNL